MKMSWALKGLTVWQPFKPDDILTLQLLNVGCEISGDREGFDAGVEIVFSRRRVGFQNSEKIIDIPIDRLMRLLEPLQAERAVTEVGHEIQRGNDGLPVRVIYCHLFFPTELGEEGAKQQMLLKRSQLCLLLGIQGSNFFDNREWADYSEE